MIEGISASREPQRRQCRAAAPQAATPPADGGSFEEALGQAVGSAVDTLKAGEATAIQGVVGATPPMRVVEFGHGRAAVAAVGARDPRQARLRLAGHLAHVDLKRAETRDTQEG